MTLDFSIVVETDNLGSASPQCLLESLQSLAQQSISPTRAREVMLINAGLIESRLGEAIRARFPWVTIHNAAAGVDYYAAKSLGVALTTGEVVVFFDCDVRYEPRWLESLLEVMSADPDVEVVTGESSLRVSGPYTLAVLLAWAFPPWSHRDRAYETTGYAAHNVAFRRRRLEAIPIPLATGVRRGNCTLHGYRLQRAGAKMLRSPQARAVHPMLTMREFYPRLWGAGFNDATVTMIERRSRGHSGWSARAYALPYVAARRTLRIVMRSMTVARWYPRWWALMPAALPVAMSGLVVSVCGAVAAILSPRTHNPAQP